MHKGAVLEVASVGAAMRADVVQGGLKYDPGRVMQRVRFRRWPVPGQPCKQKQSRVGSATSG